MACKRASEVELFFFARLHITVYRFVCFHLLHFSRHYGTFISFKLQRVAGHRRIALFI